MKAIKGLGKTIYIFLIIVVTVVSILAVSSITGFPNVLRVFVVQSGSMEPEISTGSIVFIAEATDYSVGDIVTFKTKSRANANATLTVTHRIIEKITENGQTQYVTKGDANNVEDLDKVSEQQIIGKSIFHLPYIGYVVGFAKTQLGFVLLVIIPATIIVYHELVSIKIEVEKSLKKRKKGEKSNEITSLL